MNTLGSNGEAVQIQYIQHWRADGRTDGQRQSGVAAAATSVKPSAPTASGQSTSDQVGESTNT
jgi:hypothetical protein